MHYNNRSILVASAVSAMVLLLSSLPIEAERLSLEKCEQLAMEHSLEASSAKTKLESDRLSHQASEASQKPTVTLTSLGSSINGQDEGKITVLPLSVGLGLKHPIGQLFPAEGFLANTSSIDAKFSEISWQTAQLDYAMNALNLKYQVRAAYVNYLRSQAGLELSKEEQKRIDSNLLPEINAKLKAGIATKLDVLKIESQSRNAGLTVAKAEHALDQALDALLLLIGPAAASEPLELEALDIVSSSTEPSTALDELTKNAVEHRVEIKKADLSLEQAKLGARRTQVSNSMNLTLSSKYNKTWGDGGIALGAQVSISSKDMTVNGSLTGSKAMDSMNGAGSDWQINLGLSSPILDWGKAEAERQQAQKDVEAAVISRQQMENSIRNEVRDAFYSLHEAQEKLTVSRMNLEASESSLSITRARYDVGAASSSELLDSELVLFEAKSSVSQAEYDLFNAKDKLFKAMGVERSAAK